MNSELKSCPFCGASYDKDEDDFVYAADHENWCPLRGMAYGGYGLTVGDTEEEINAWNTRAELTGKQVITECNDGLMPPFTAHCGECGVQWGYTPNYCPNCGVKVVG